MKGPPPSTPISVSFPPFPGSYLSPPLATLRSAPTTRHWPVCLSPFHAEQARWRSMSGWLTAGLILGPPRGPLRERGLGDEARQATTLRQDPPARTRSLLPLSPPPTLFLPLFRSLSLSPSLSPSFDSKIASPRVPFSSAARTEAITRGGSVHTAYTSFGREKLFASAIPRVRLARARNR